MIDLATATFPYIVGVPEYIDGEWQYPVYDACGSLVLFAPTPAVAQQAMAVGAEEELIASLHLEGR